LLLAEAHLMLADPAACRADLDAIIGAATATTPGARCGERGHLLCGLLATCPPPRASAVARQAMAELSEAVRLGERSAGLFFDAALAAEHTGDYTTAVALYGQSLSLSDDFSARLRRGCALRIIGRLNEARDDFARAARMRPADPKAHFWL